MANTTNFNWETPDDTDLVKDGAAAIRTLGNSIDTSFVDLKGGTTGQVLSKASNTDLDFTWATDASGIPATIFDAKGDIIAASAADTAARLAVGTNGQYLSADSTTATGLKWVAAPSSSSTLSLVTSGTLSGSTVTISSLTSYDRIILQIESATQSADSQVYIRINGSSSSIYRRIAGQGRFEGSSASANSYNGLSDGLSLSQGGTGYDSAGTNGAAIILSNCKEAGYTYLDSVSVFRENGGTYIYTNFYRGAFESNAAVSSVSIVSNGSSFTGGSYYVYGA